MGSDPAGGGVEGSGGPEDRIALSSQLAKLSEVSGPAGADRFCFTTHVKGEEDLAEQVTVLLKPWSSSELVEAERPRPNSKETATATPPSSLS